MLKLFDLASKLIQCQKKMHVSVYTCSHLFTKSTNYTSYARVSLLLPLLRSYLIVCKHNPRIEYATRRPLHERALVISRNITDFGKRYCGQSWSISRSKLVIGSGAPKPAMSRQKPIDITI